MEEEIGITQDADRAAAAVEGEEELVLDDSKRSKNALAKRLWALGGFVCFGLGAVGAVFPVIPTTPFLLLAAFCFARSSERIDRWFHGTKLYHQVLEGYTTKRMMTVKAKLTILVPVSILMLIAFICMRKVPVGQAVLAVVWVAHVVYFGFIVKTDHDPQEAAAKAEGDAEEGRPADAEPKLAADEESSQVERAAVIELEPLPLVEPVLAQTTVAED